MDLYECLVGAFNARYTERRVVNRNEERVGKILGCSFQGELIVEIEYGGPEYSVDPYEDVDKHEIRKVRIDEFAEYILIC